MLWVKRFVEVSCEEFEDKDCKGDMREKNAAWISGLRIMQKVVGSEKSYCHPYSGIYVCVQGVRNKGV